MPVLSARSSSGDQEELLNHARRYFQAAAQSTERRKMQLLVNLGLEYLKLAVQLERARLHRRGSSRKQRALHEGRNDGTESLLNRCDPGRSNPKDVSGKTAN